MIICKIAESLISSEMQKAPKNQSRLLIGPEYTYPHSLYIQALLRKAQENYEHRRAPVGWVQDLFPEHAFYDECFHQTSPRAEHEILFPSL